MQKRIGRILKPVSWISGIILIFTGHFVAGAYTGLIILAAGVWVTKEIRIPDIVSFSIFIIAGFSTGILKNVSFYPFTGIIVYSVFFLCHTVSLLIKILKKKRSIKENLFWISVFGINLVISIALMPDYLYIVIPIIIVILSLFIKKILIHGGAA